MLSTATSLHISQITARTKLSARPLLKLQRQSIRKCRKLLMRLFNPLLQTQARTQPPSQPKLLLIPTALQPLSRAHTRLLFPFQTNSLRQKTSMNTWFPLLKPATLKIASAIGQRPPLKAKTPTLLPLQAAPLLPSELAVKSFLQTLQTQRPLLLST